MSLDSVDRYAEQPLLLAVAYSSYLVVKTAFLADIELRAHANALKIISFERAAGLYYELGLQEWALDSVPWLIGFAGHYYSYGLFPLLIAAAIVAIGINYQKYFRYRNVLLITFVIGLSISTLYPVAPPRLLPDEGFLDTIEAFGPALYDDRVALTTDNPYAAMPSLHLGWSVLVSFFIASTKKKASVLLGIAHTILMTLSVVLTANHFIIDTIVCVGVLVIAFGLAHLIEIHRPTTPKGSDRHLSRALRSGA